jgi:hypothetical protein
MTLGMRWRWVRSSAAMIDEVGRAGLDVIHRKPGVGEQVADQEMYVRCRRGAGPSATRHQIEARPDRELDLQVESDFLPIWSNQNWVPSTISRPPEATTPVSGASTRP